MKQRLFRFKQFSVDHSRSAMKVGVDSVLLGAWAPLCGASRILDVGSGCGLLALMAAQRNGTARIDAVEIEEEAAAESACNFKASPWSDRLHIIRAGFESFASLGENRARYDFIISNPPYFRSGVDSATDSRMLARHQGDLSPSSLLETGRLCLANGGHIAMVLPCDIAASMLTIASSLGYVLQAKCDVRGRMELPPKRSLLLWRFKPEAEKEIGSCIFTELILEKNPGEPTEQHRDLCRDFYLKF